MFWTQEIWSQTQCRYSKGFITSFEEHDYLSPTFHSEFNYMGEKWQCIGEAYDCLAEEVTDESEKIRIMGNIIYHFFKHLKWINISSLCIIISQSTTKYFNKQKTVPIFIVC